MSTGRFQLHSQMKQPSAARLKALGLNLSRITEEEKASAFAGRKGSKNGNKHLLAALWKQPASSSTDENGGGPGVLCLLGLVELVANEIKTYPTRRSNR